MKRIAVLPVLALLLAGCQVSPPATHISFNPSTKAFTLDSPKQVDAQEITVADTNGLQVHIVGLKSENDAAIIGAVAQYQLEQGKQLLQALDKLQAIAAGVAAKAATGGVAP